MAKRSKPNERAAIQVPGGLTDEVRDALQIEFGLAPHVPLNHVYFDLAVFSPKLGGWRWDIYGIPPAAPIPADFPDMQHHHCIYRTDGGEGLAVGRRPPGFDETHEIVEEYSLVVVSQRLRRPPSTAYAEMRWHPALGIQRLYGGIEGVAAANISKLSRCFEMFENLKDFRVRGGGRPTNRSKPHPLKVDIAKRAAVLRAAESALSWDQIAARLMTKYSGKTLQRWVEVDRLHEI